MKNLTIGQKIAAGFTAIVVICVGLGLFSIKQLHTITTLSTVTTTESLEGMDCVGRLESVAHENNLLLIKDLMTKNEDLKTDLELQLQTNLLQMTALTVEYQKNKHSTEAQAAGKTFDTARQDYANNIVTVTKLSHDGKNQEAIELKQHKVDTFLAVIQAEEQANKQNGKVAAQQVQNTASKTQISILIGFAVMLIAAVLIAFGITLVINRVLNKVSSQLNKGSAEIFAAANQVATSSQSLAEGSGEQAASIEETSSSLEELSSMTRRNSENAQQANDLAKQARHAADKGAGDMQAMSTAMDAIKVSSDDIAKIIKTIDEIAFQTNILALNAAVEAARAGEAGMGFAVVADEVRNLAQRSAQAAKETAAKIEGAIVKTGQGVEISSKVMLALNEIVTKVRQVDELVTEVAGASREQTQGITQINTAVAQMDKVTQSNAASSQESAAAAQELNAQAETLKQSVAELLQLVGAQNQTATNIPTTRPKPAPESQTSSRMAGKHPATNGTRNGNGHAPKVLITAGKQRNEIPLKGDFKDF